MMFHMRCHIEYDWKKSLQYSINHFWNYLQLQQAVICWMKIPNQFQFQFVNSIELVEFVFV